MNFPISNCDVGPLTVNFPISSCDVGPLIVNLYVCSWTVTSVTVRAVLRVSTASTINKFFQSLMLSHSTITSDITRFCLLQLYMRVCVCLILQFSFYSDTVSHLHCHYVVIHAEHVLHRRGYCFHFGCMYVCMYVSALERKRLIGMT